MSRIPVLNAETAPLASKPFIEKSQSSNGFLPNLIGVLAHAPTALEGVSLATLCNFANNLAVTEINPQLTPYLPATI